ncbi:hypothetical protein M569_17145, partial [Genlisea aurea]
VSGLSGSKETAQKQVSVGIGLLAGSTVMLLTVIWGSCVVVGKCDLQNNVSIDSQDTKCFSPTGSGVSTDVWTSYAARIMAVSVVPFVVVQLPQILHSNSGRHLAVLIALVVSALLLAAYCSYQVFQPWIQRRRLAYARHKHVVSGILKHFKMRSLGKLSDGSGNPNREVLRKLFHTIDENDDGFLSHSELRALIAGIQLELVNLDYDEAVSKVLQDFDSSRDNRVDLDEFVAGVGKWLHEARGRGIAADSMAYIDEHHKKTRAQHDLLQGGGGAEQEDDEAAQDIENRRWVTIKAAIFLVLGTAIAAAFADPLVDAVDNFSSATKIPTFFISFVALPLATNSSEAVSAIIFASRKKMRSASLTFSELYGAATMNNVLCLSVFLALVYVRGLNWNFSSEVLVILIVCIAIGVFGSFRTTFPLWSCSVAFFLYPFSLGLVYLLDYHFGWS